MPFSHFWAGCRPDGVALTCSLILLAPRALAADAALAPTPASATPPALPAGTRSSQPAAPAPIRDEDMRFNEIGRYTSETEVEKPPITAGVSASALGKVTYAAVRVDVPLSARWSVIPEAAIVNVRPTSIGGETFTTPYLGAGIGYRPRPSWSLELSGLFGPAAFGVGLVGGTFAVIKGFGASEASDYEPVVQIDAAGSVRALRWTNDNGPAGRNMTQTFVQVALPVRATSRLHVVPKGMIFVYDRSLDGAVGERLGTVSTLAMVGSYAPSGLAGLRLGYKVPWTDAVAPFVEGDRIWYAAGIGNATELLAGAQLRFAKSVSGAVYGGALFNRVGGPLVEAGDELRTVPVVGAEAQVSF